MSGTLYEKYLAGEAPMLFSIMEAAANWSNGNSQDKLMLLTLIMRGFSMGEAWPSVATLSRWTDLDARTVRKSMARLTELGFIVVEQRPGSTNLIRFDRAKILQVVSDHKKASVSTPGKNVPPTQMPVKAPASTSGGTDIHASEGLTSMPVKTVKETEIKTAKQERERAHEQLAADGHSEHDIATPCTQQQQSSPSEHWRRAIRFEAWAQDLIDAYCKIGADNFHRWKALVDKHGIAAVVSEAANLPHSTRWDDRVAERLEAAGPDSKQAFAAWLNAHPLARCSRHDHERWMHLWTEAGAELVTKAYRLIEEKNPGQPIYVDQMAAKFKKVEG